MGILPSFHAEVEEIQDTIIEKSEEVLEKKRTYKFDFEKNEFVTDVAGAVLKTMDPQQLLEQTVNKVLHDARFKYPIYSDDYGNEVDYILAQDDPPEVVEMELKRVYEEALIYHPLIAKVGSFLFETEGDSIYCSFVVEGTSGDLVTYREEVTTWTRQAL